jgi:hypothetical protein
VVAFGFVVEDVVLKGTEVVLCIMSAVPIHNHLRTLQHHVFNNKPKCDHVFNNFIAVLPIAVWNYARWLERSLRELVLPWLLTMPLHHNNEHQLYDVKHHRDDNQHHKHNNYGSVLHGFVFQFWRWLAGGMQSVVLRILPKVSLRCNNNN